jgi:hypothetical protein
MATCNRCILERIRRDAAAADARVHLKADPLGPFAGGTMVFVVPKGEQLDTSLDADGNPGRQFKLWAAEIGEACGC